MTGGGKDPPGRDPYFQRCLRLRKGRRTFTFLAPHSVFSASRLDAGTRLLLDHLPPGKPGRFLDLGCGYGALGLPVAAEFPGSHGVLIDRDLLAVRYAGLNAARNGIRGVTVLPGLGFRDLPPEEGPFEWILLNAPARAGETVLAHFLTEGLAHLRPGGEIRLVIIAPLSGTVEQAAKRRGISCARVAEGPRHVVFRVPSQPIEGEARQEDLDVYLRDRIRLELTGDVELLRPTDLADEPHRLSQAIFLLDEWLPADLPSRILAFRCGYGLVPALLLGRCPRARVTAVDRDLLATAFTRLNCRSHQDRLRVVESVAPEAPEGPPHLIVAELSPPLGPAATIHEVEQLRFLLAPGGKALLLGLLKQWREVLQPESGRLGLTLLAGRGPVGLVEMQRQGGRLEVRAPDTSCFPGSEVC
jgi:16S rRNA (guanine1207-N2)-methyltransferase